MKTSSQRAFARVDAAVRSAVFVAPVLRPVRRARSSRIERVEQGREWEDDEAVSAGDESKKEGKKRHGRERE